MGNNTSALLEAASNGDSRAVELALRKTGASDLSSCDEVLDVPTCKLSDRDHHC